VLQAGQKGSGGAGLFHSRTGSRRCGQIGQPLGQQLGPEEGKNAAGAGLRVEPIGEMGFYAGGLKQKGQWARPGGQAVGQALGVAGRLHFHAREGGALLLGLDDAAGLAVDVQQIVGKAKAGVEGKLADGHAWGGVDVGIRHAAHMPTRCGEQRINVLTGAGFWRHRSPLGRILGKP
jgi:hypothetical protein